MVCRGVLLRGVEGTIGDTCLVFEKINLKKVFGGGNIFVRFVRVEPPYMWEHTNQTCIKWVKRTKSTPWRGNLSYL